MTHEKNKKKTRTEYPIQNDRFEVIEQKKKKQTIRDENEWREKNMPRE